MTELFYRMKKEDIPTDKQDSRYSAFWENEKKKVERGLNIDGYQISGWLYWHINHWKITADIKSEWGEIVPDIITPTLRDNEVVLNDTLLEAELKREGITIMGLRQFSKTSMMSSYAGRTGILFRGSQNLIMGTNSDDLSNITQSLDFGLLNCTAYFRIPRISRDWSSERVLLGVKKKSGDNMVHSTYVIRNTTGGKQTEKGAGVSNLKCNLWDEQGKNDFLQALIGTKPAMLSEFGWRCIPLCFGTGGNVDKAQDAKTLFFNPKAHNFLEFTQPDGRKTGLFLPGWYRQDCKYKTSLGHYLLEEGKLKEIPKDSELFQIEILVSDKAKATAKINKELADFLEAGDITSYNRWRAYYPLEVDDVFLTESHNNFPIQAIKPHKQYLEDEVKPEYTSFYRDKDNKVVREDSKLLPIKKFPVKQQDLKIAPVCVYERPEKLPLGVYVMGIDPINEDTSSDKEVSLGSFYVKKRMYNPLGGYQNQMVASFCGRFDSLKEFHQLCLDTAEYYNALVLPENEEKTLIQFFINKKKDYLLFESFDLAKRINPLSKSSRSYGLSASTPNQRYGMTLIVEAANEEIFVDDETSILGVTKILDPMLLEEYINYRGKPQGSKGVHDGNFDRIISWYLTEILAAHLDNVMPLSNIRIEKEDTKDKPKHLQVDSPWFSVKTVPTSFNNRNSTSPFFSIKKY